MRRVPTEKQYRRLAVLAKPSVGLMAGERSEWLSLASRGWLEDDAKNPELLRITPAGLRALADALEEYGR